MIRGFFVSARRQPQPQAGVTFVVVNPTKFGLDGFVKACDLFQFD
jgi:hypothetical protein